MRYLNVPITIGKDKDGKPITQMSQEIIYKIDELSYLGKLLSAKDSKKRGVNYIELPAAFDIETTNICAPLDPQEDFFDKEVFDYLSSLKIRYNDRIKADIPDFEKLRRSYFGKLKLSKSKGTKVDILYTDLMELRPDLFPDISNESDKLLKILEVFDNNTPTKNEFRPYAFMYHWQFCLDDQVVFGRTWEEFQYLMHQLERNMNLSYTNRLVVWVHQLGFEWQFMRNFIEFEEGFFLDERKPAKILTKGGIEFRCSYILSNMGLAKFCENEQGVTHYKLDGDDYDYGKLRLPTTPLSEYEQGYCYNDVRGLCECIKSRLNHDTLGTIPMTSTGYVRRDLRTNVKKNRKNREFFLNSKLDEHLYTMCREAFRGGDTHANSNHSNQLVKNGWGWDIKSSYPGQMIISDHFPFSAFAKIMPSTYINMDPKLKEHTCFIMQVAFYDIHYDVHGVNYCGMPYIALAKCEKHSAKHIIDNGRVIYAEFLLCTLTDIDLDIIMSEYKIGDIKIGEIWASQAAKLSKEIRDTVLYYFQQKTLLDGIEEQKYLYSKMKALLNAIYGCFVMRIDQTTVKWDPVKQIYFDDTPKLEEALEKFYKGKNNFLSYQQGVFVTALARQQLRKMLWKVGKDCVYCDTDSIKGIGDHKKDFEEENAYRKQLAIDAGAFAEDSKGNPYYLSLWECETIPVEEGGKGIYEEFKTLGAKKYCYKQNGKIKSTIAGVSKEAGAAYFGEHGVDGLSIDAVITDSGHLTAYYNDDKDVYKLTIDHNTFTTSSNVALVNNTYKIGVTDEYYDLLLKGIENIIDML